MAYIECHQSKIKLFTGNINVAYISRHESKIKLFTGNINDLSYSQATLMWYRYAIPNPVLNDSQGTRSYTSKDMFEWIFTVLQVE